MKRSLAAIGAKPIVLLAAIAQAVQYYVAFDLVLVTLPPALRVTGGAAAGTALVWSVSYVGNRLPTLAGKTAKRLGYGFGAAILVLSPVTLTLAHVAPRLWLTIGLLATLPELALAAAALVDRALFAQQAAHSKPLEPRSETQQTAKRSKKSQTMVSCPHCGRSMSQNGLNAHIRYCNSNPERRAKFSQNNDNTVDKNGKIYYI